MRLAASLSVLILAIGPMVAAGCATTSKNPGGLQASEYRRILERQKAEMAAEEKAARKVPEMTAEGYEKLGDRYLGQGHRDLAFMQYHRSIEMDPSRWRVRYKMGHLYLGKGLKDEARREFQEILKMDPKQAWALEGIGRVHFQSGQYPEAETHLRQALDLDPSLWPAHNFLGILYDRQGRFELAAGHYRAAIAAQPQAGFLFNNLGVSLLLSGEAEKAAAALAEALRLDPKNPRIHNNMGLALAKLERYREAFEAFSRAGDEATAYYNLGCIYLLRGKDQEALQALEKAIEMKPGFYVKAHEKIKKAKEAGLRPAHHPESGNFPPAPQ